MFSLHIAAVLFSLIMILIADEDAFAWMRGKKPVMNQSRLSTLHWLTWLGLGTLIVSGSFLAYPQLSYLLAQPLFIIKMLFVAILITNAFLIGKLSHTATIRSYAQLSESERIRLITSGAISLFGWAGAIIMALVFFK